MPEDPPPLSQVQRKTALPAGPDSAAHAHREVPHCPLLQRGQRRRNCWVWTLTSGMEREENPLNVTPREIESRTGAPWFWRQVSPCSYEMVQSQLGTWALVQYG